MTAAAKTGATQAPQSRHQAARGALLSASRRFAAASTAILLTGLAAWPAHAQVMQWILPTERVDGSELPLDELLGTQIYCNGDAVAIVLVPTTTFDAGVLPPGGYSCFVTAWDVGELESAPSNTAALSVPEPPPGPPGPAENLLVSVLELPPSTGPPGSGQVTTYVVTEADSSNRRNAADTYFSGSNVNEMREQASDNIFNDFSNFEVAKFDTGVYRNTVVSFTLPTPPSGEVLQSATLSIYVTNTFTFGPSINHTISAYRVLRSADPVEISWDNYASASAWQVGGAQGAADRSAAVGSESGITDTGAIAIDVTAAVSADYAAAQARAYVLLERTDGADDTTALIFGGPEADTGFAPELVLVYAAEPGGETVEADLDVEPAVLAASVGVERTVSAALSVSNLTMAASLGIAREASAALDVAALQLNSTADAVRDVSAALNIEPLVLAANGTIERSAEVALLLQPAVLAASGAVERNASAALTISAPELLSDVLIARTASAALAVQPAVLSGSVGSDTPVSGALSVSAPSLSAGAGVERTASAALSVEPLALESQVSIVRLASGELALLVPVLDANVMGEELTATAALQTPMPVLDVSAAISRTATGALSITAPVLDAGVSRAAQVEAALIVTLPDLSSQAALARMASGELTLAELEMAANVFEGAIQRVIGVRADVAAPMRVASVSAPNRTVMVGPRRLQ